MELLARITLHFFIDMTVVVIRCMRKIPRSGYFFIDTRHLSLNSDKNKLANILSALKFYNIQI